MPPQSQPRAKHMPLNSIGNEGPGVPNATKPLWYQPGVIKAKTANRMPTQLHANFLLVMGRCRSPAVWGLPEILQAVISWPAP